MQQGLLHPSHLVVNSEHRYCNALRSKADAAPPQQRRVLAFFYVCNLSYHTVRFFPQLNLSASSLQLASAFGLHACCDFVTETLFGYELVWTSQQCLCILCFVDADTR